MSRMLIDTSVWIAYFRGDEKVKILNDFIDSNRICVNDLILSELLPFIKIKEKNELAELLETINRLPIKIDWEQIREYQMINLKNGINKVGIPDLIIFQNTIANDVKLFSLDKHFKLMAKHIECKAMIF